MSRQVDILNRLCREQFVALHSEPILEDLSASLWEKFSYSVLEISNNGTVADIERQTLNNVIRSVPRKGEFDISEVLGSTYFFG